MDVIDEEKTYSINFRCNSDLYHALTKSARDGGRKTGAHARYLLEIALGLRNPEPALRVPKVATTVE